LDLLSYRAISNAIAQQLEVTHQSPQLLVIKNGKAVAHASHEQINSLLLIDYVS
jgi:bacillithiol system protein YtxJ